MYPGSMPAFYDKRIYDEFRLADVLGVDQDTGERCCHGRISYKKAEKFFGDDSVFSKKELDSIAGSLKGTEGIYLTDFNVQVLAEDVPTARLEKRYIALS